MLKMKEEFPVDADGNEVFTVKAGGIIDVAGNYVLSDAGPARTSSFWTTTTAVAGHVEDSRRDHRGETG